MGFEAKKLSEVSKGNFTFMPNASGKWDIDYVKLSFMLRQTEALEAMAVNQTNLQRAHDFYKKQNAELHKEIEFLKRSAASYKGKLRHELNAKQDLAVRTDNILQP